MPAADEYTLSRYTRTKHHCHNTTRRHRPISRSCLLPSCHCCHRAAASPCALLPGDNRPRTPRAAASTPRRCPRPRRGSRPPSHTLCPTHRDCPACPCRQRQPRWRSVSPSPMAINSLQVQQAVCVAADGPLPAPQGLRLILGLAPGGGVPNTNALCWRSARSPFLSSPPRASGTRSHRRQPRARRSTQRGWHQARGVPGSKAPAHWRSILARTVPHAPRRHARSETWLGASAAAVAATAGSDGSCRTDCCHGCDITCRCACSSCSCDRGSSCCGACNGCCHTAAAMAAAATATAAAVAHATAAAATATAAAVARVQRPL